jgi:hypothetical protein
MFNWCPFPTIKPQVIKGNEYMTKGERWSLQVIASIDIFNKGGEKEKGEMASLVIFPCY